MNFRYQMNLFHYYKKLGKIEDLFVNYGMER